MRLPPASCFALLASAMLTACVHPAATEGPPQSGAVATPVTEESLPRFIGVVGAKAQHAPPFLGVPQTNFYCLRSFVDRRTGETQHQLYVSDSYSGAERQWNAARDDAGRPLRVIEISRNEITCDGGCSYAEEFAAVIPEGELRASPRGLSVIFAGRSGAEKTIAVSSSQIDAQLAAVDTRRAPVQPAAALSSSAHQ